MARTSTATRDARGGVSWTAVITGVVVAFGAMAILTSVIAGALAGTETDARDIFLGELSEVAIGVAVAVLVAQFLSYLWGGYTAGRMARGAGLLNGLLVPLLAIIVALAVAAVVAFATDYEDELESPYGYSLTGPLDDFQDQWPIAVAALGAMFLGGIAGGLAGARWHTRLEHRVYDKRERAVQADRPTWDEQTRKERQAREAETREAVPDRPPNDAAAERHDTPRGRS